MKLQDASRHQSQQLNDLEDEEREKNEELRQKAFEQAHEQDDEIKRLNEVRQSWGYALVLLEASALCGDTSLPDGKER